MFKMYVDPHIDLTLLEPYMAEEYLALVEQNREHLQTWLPWPRQMRSTDDAMHFIARTRKQWVQDEGFTAGVLYKGELCGIAGYNSLNRKQGHIALGYWLGQAYLGKGIMRKVCSRLIDYAFDIMGLHRIEIRTEVSNVKSRAIPEKLGFTEEGIARHAAYVNDTYVDHVIYGLLAEEWNQRRNCSYT